MKDNYIKALSRDDLSQWLVHFCKCSFIDGNYYTPFDALRNIMRIGKVFASKVECITRFDSEGAACFYDVPPQNYKELINTNPNNRKGYGLIVSKTAFWYKGGRPAIYTENTYCVEWPTSERFRLIHTDLDRSPTPIDWTHEREWRVRGDFTLSGIDIMGTWWWPCVETIFDSQMLFSEFNDKLHSIYVIELNRVLNKNEIKY